MRTYKYPIIKLEPHQIFVFGSNTQGRHGKGAALWAKQNAGAIYGQASGLQGQSYAIITKDLTKKIHPSISMYEIYKQIQELYVFASNRPDNEFLIAYSNGTNLNGYTPIQMAGLFKEVSDNMLGNRTMPDNIIFEEEFSKLIVTESV